MSETRKKHGVLIRPITEADTGKILKWRNDPSVMEHFIYRTALTAEMHLNWYYNRVQTGEVAQFIIIDIDTGEEVGSAYLRDIDTANKKCEFGIFIGEVLCRGKGIGSVAATLALKYAFEELGLNRVFLRVFADNTQAIKSYENAGFRYEGTFREDVIIDGVGYDMTFMGILRAEWDNMRKGG